MESKQEKPFQIEDLAAESKLPEKHIPTPQEIGRARRSFFTVQHPEVVACGHRLDQGRPPNTNCDYCWYAYFKTAVDLGKLHDELIAIGSHGLRAKYGNKFVKNFKKVLDYELSLPTPDQAAVEEGSIGIPEETRSSEAA